MLYQRYFLKMNQSNMTNLITLLLLLCISMVVLAGVDLVLPRLTGIEEAEEVNKGAEEGFIERATRFDKLLVLMCTAACCIAIYSSKYTLASKSLVNQWGKFLCKLDNK